MKNKILDKADQLQKDSLNVVIYNISRPLLPYERIESAFLGRRGAIHKEKCNKISLLIAFKEFQYDSHRKYLNPNSTIKIPEEIVEKL